MAGSVVLAAVLVGLVDPIVRIVSTPEQAVAGTRTYLIICFIGVPCITAYNIMASIFRGLGDPEADVLYCGGLCKQHCAGLSVHGLRCILALPVQRWVPLFLSWSA